jgi:sialidase-1
MFFHEPQLQTPVVHCSLSKTGRSFIFVGPGDTDERKNLSIWISEDESLTWKGPWLIQEGPAAYSSSVGLNKGEIGILYETGNNMPYECIQFMLIRFD